MNQQQLEHTLELHNKWLKAWPKGERADFSQLDLTDLSFENKTLIGISFANADLSNSNFNGATIKKCNFDSAIFHCKFNDVTASNSTFRRANFQAMEINGIHMTDTDFFRATFFAAKISASDFSSSNFKDTNLHMGQFCNVNFKEVDFSGSDFGAASFVEVSWEKTIVKYINIDNIQHIDNEIKKRIEASNGPPELDNVIDLNHYREQKKATRPLKKTTMILTKKRKA